MGDHSSLKQMLVENEGRIPYMYLDTVGRVTLAIGHMIPLVTAAQKLTLRVRGSGAPATPEQIASEFNQVQSQEPGRAAEHYRQFTLLEMADDAIDQLLDADIAAMEAGVKQRFAKWDSFPEPAQDALLDMAFNLGVAGLVSKFPKLKAAADAQDWNTCAAQCRRIGISDDRNQKTKNLFLQAAGS